MNPWTLLAMILIAAIFYRSGYEVPYDTCNEIWLHADPASEEARIKRYREHETDPEQAEFVAQCMAALSNSDLFDSAYWTAKAQGR